jgi:hypothetical protein
MANKDEIQGIHAAVLRHFVKTGRAPHYIELGDTLQVPPDRARQLLRETIEASPYSFAWLVPETDYISAWAPFSSLPNHFLVSVEGEQKWYGQ